MQKHRFGKPGSAPFPALYNYRDQQKQSGIVLRRDDFDTDFLCWASRYLKTSADFILNACQSLVKLIDDEHSRRRSEQERRTQGEASRKALLKGLERIIPDSSRCNCPRHEDPNSLPYRWRWDNATPRTSRHCSQGWLRRESAIFYPLCSKCTTLRSNISYAYQVYLCPQEWGRNALERVVGYPGTENTDPHATMSDAFSGRPREGKGQRIYYGLAASISLCISIQANRTGQEELLPCLWGGWLRKVY